MCRTSRPYISLWWPHILEGFGCVCTLKDLIFGSLCLVHKLTVRSLTVQIAELLPTSTLSIFGWCAAGGRRSWSCSSRPVLPSMPPLRVSGAELQHRPPLSSTLRTLIHTPERGSYLQQHTHWAKTLCVCTHLLKHYRGARKQTSCAHLQTPYVHLCLCVFCIWDYAYTHPCLL